MVSRRVSADRKVQPPNLVFYSLYNETWVSSVFNVIIHPRNSKYDFSTTQNCILRAFYKHSKFHKATLGATLDACKGHMRQMHVVCTSNKAHKAAFGIERQALWHALCLCVGEQSLQQSHPLSVKGSFVVFIPSADHMHLSHVASACVACCPQCEICCFCKALAVRLGPEPWHCEAEEFCFLGYSLSSKLANVNLTAHHSKSIAL
jgi:hypothetical protein